MERSGLVQQDIGHMVMIYTLHIEFILPITTKAHRLLPFVSLVQLIVVQSDPTHGGWHSSGLSFNLEDSLKRIKLLLHMDGDQENHTAGEQLRRSKYGLGDRRTFEQLVEFSGVDPIHRRTLRDRCGNIEYVPFMEHPLGPEYIPRFDETTFAPLDEPDEGSIYYQKDNEPHSRSIDEKNKIFEKRKYLLNEMKMKLEEVRIAQNPPVEAVIRNSEPEVRTTRPEIVLSEVIGRVEGTRIEAYQSRDSKDVNESIWTDIAMELCLFFLILFGCYYCTFLPNRSTKVL
jgi:hypothetical protein